MPPNPNPQNSDRANTVMFVVFAGTGENLPRPTGLQRRFKTMRIEGALDEGFMGAML